MTAFSGRNLSTQSLLGAGNQSLRTRMVDLVVNGQNIENLAGAGTVGTSVPRSGTSYAAPQIAGAAGLLKHWAYTIGGPISDARHDPYALRVMLAAMGDGASGTSSGGTRNAIDPETGFGHLRFTVPSFLGADGHWKLGYHMADDNDVIEIPIGTSDGPEPMTMTGWKFAALMDVNSYGSAPRVVFELIDKCSPGGGWTVLQTSVDSTHKGRLRILGSEMATKYRGRCMWVRARVSDATGPFPLHWMEYGYSNARVNHDMP